MSPIKIFSYEILEDLKQIGYKKIKQSWLKPIADRLINYVFRPAIRDSSDEELFKDMFNIFRKLEKYFTKMETVTQIKEAESLGSPKVPRLGDIKKAMELVNEYM